MIFSVITPSLNTREHLLECIESVRSQGLPPAQFEHLIVDGGSTDGTVELLRTQPNLNWSSEPDRGLADAVNKGILRSRGEWIVWLNSDDVLAENAFRTFLEFSSQHPGIRIFAGDLVILRYDGTFEQRVQGWDYNLDDLLGTKTGINQPATFVHRSVFESVGLLDVSNRYTMDYEWIVRAMHKYKCVPIPHVLAFYRRRKASITDANQVKQYEDFLRIRHAYGKSRLSAGELRSLFYIYTDGLRRNRRVRNLVRSVKRMFGCEPPHTF